MNVCAVRLDSYVTYLTEKFIGFVRNATRKCPIVPKFIFLVSSQIYRSKSKS